MIKATINTAPAVLNTNDKAMWVTGWNECLDSPGLSDALSEAERALSYITSSSAPMTSQQEQCWPSMVAALNRLKALGVNQ